MEDTVAYSSDKEILTVPLNENGCQVNTVQQNFSTKIVAMMDIEGQRVQMLVDSGASCNVLPKKYLPKGTSIVKSNNTLVMYSKSTMPVIGSSQIHIVNPKNGMVYPVDFVIVENYHAPLLGARTAQQMNLLIVKHQNILNTVEETPSHQQNESNEPQLTLEDITQQYQDVFSAGLGRMEGTVHLTVDEKATPVVMQPRRVPVAVKDKLKEELDRLTKAGAITPIEEPTDWVSNIITVQKPDGRIRVCIDPLHLNKGLKRSHYPLPVIEEILPELSKAKVFSKADIKEGFLQVELDAESSKLPAFQTPWGRYKWLRMPFGISPAPELFQMKLNQNLEGLKGVFKIADDLLIIGQGDTQQEADKDHDRNLRELLDRCRTRNINLNKAKFQFKCEEMQFIGHSLIKDGQKPDPTKVEAILKIKKPVDVPGVRLMGMIKYLSKFLSGLSQVCEPIRRLTHKNVQWYWS